MSKLIGGEALVATLSGIASGLPKVVREAIINILIDVMVESEELIPVDTGTAQSSSFIDINETADGSVEGSFGYAGESDPINPKTNKPASEYIVELHEDLSMNHPNGGTAKFLEIPVLRAIPKLSALLGQKITVYLSSYRK